MGIPAPAGGRGIGASQPVNPHVLPAFAGRILAIDAAVARQCARLHVPNPHPLRDTYIAATAQVHRMTLVTRNVADFKPTGAALFDPWRDVR